VVDFLTVLGRTLGFSLAAGVNLYATVAIIGLAHRFGWATLPAEYAVFDNDWIIGAALVLYLVEFVADKVPWLDTIWDAVHTVIRPVGGAVIAVASLGDASVGLKAAAAIAGGSLAAGTHFTKAGTRVVANTSPEPFSNWILSLLEDGFVVAMGVIALQYPVAALIVSGVIILVLLACAAALVRALRRRFGRGAVTTAGAG
jgi:Domain of unknown function (DUF4126)